MNKLKHLVFYFVRPWFLLITILIGSIVYSEDYKTNVINLTKNKFKIEYDDIKLSILPWPKLIIAKGRSNNETTSFVNAKLHFSLLSLMLFKPKISSIDLDKLNIQYTQNNIDFLSNNALAQRIFKLYDAMPEDIKINVKNLLLHSSGITATNYYLSNVTYNKYNQKKIKFKYNQEAVTIQIITNTNNNQLVFSIVSPYCSLERNTTFIGGQLQETDLNIKIKNLAGFLENSIVTKNYKIPPIIASVPLNISVKSKQNGSAISLEKLLIESDAISAQGSGSMGSSTNLINLDFAFIDLNKLLAPADINSILKSDFPLLLSINNPQVNFNVTITKMLASKEVLQNIQLILSAGALKQLSGNFASGGRFSASGLLSSNPYRSMFEGSINFEHNDINLLLSNLNLLDYTSDKQQLNNTFSSKVIATNLDLQLLNFIYKVNGATLSGNLRTQIFANKPCIRGLIKLDNLDFANNSYPIISKLLSYSNNIIPYKNNDYKVQVAKITPEILSGNLELMFTNSYFIKDYLIKHLGFIIDIVPNKLKISKINLAVNDNNMSGNAIFFTDNIKPSLTLNLAIDNLNAINIDNTTLWSAIQKANDVYDFQQLIITLASSINKASFMGLNFSDVTFNATNSDNNLIIEKFGGNYLGGKFEINGNVALYPLTLSLAYALNSVPANQLYTMSKGLLPFVDGHLSIAGNLYTKGKDANELFYHIASNNHFVGKDLLYRGADLDGLVSLLNTQNYNADNLSNDTNKFTSNGSTIFKTMSGDLNINKGIFTIDKLLGNSAFTSSSLTGNYNIYQNNINLAATTTFYLTQYLTAANSVQASNILVSFKSYLSGLLSSANKSFVFDQLHEILKPKQQ
jgi:hypothetical protein